MQYFLKIVFLVLLIEVGVIIGAIIPKNESVAIFSQEPLTNLSEISLNEFEIAYSEAIKDSKGLGLGKGIIQFYWNMNYQMGVDATDFDFQAEYEDHKIIVTAPELQWFEAKVNLVKQEQLDATNQERNERIFEQATKNANLILMENQKAFLQVDSVYYQLAKFQLQQKVKDIYKKEIPDLIIEEVVIRNWVAF